MEIGSLEIPTLILIQTLEPRRFLSAAPVPIHVNAGGGFYADTLSRGFAPDSGFTGGAAVTSAPYDVLNTDDDPLFLSYRAGMHFTYAANVPNGHYALWLEFAEPDAAAGQRVFDVSAQGVQILDHFDIATAVGVRTATAKTFNVNVTDGELGLSFDGVSGDAIVSAVVLVPLDPTTAAQPYSSLNLSDDERDQLSQTNLQAIGQIAYFYADENKARFPASLAAALASDPSVSTIGTFADPRSDTMIPRGALSDVERVAWVSALNDYIYLGAGKGSGRPGDVLAYENRDRVTGDIDVVLGDGQTERWDRATAAARIGFPLADPTHPPTFPAGVSKDPLILQSQSNLALIQTAAGQYANNHQQRYPSQLGVLFQNYHVPLSAFINPRSNTLAPPDSWTVQQKVDWINASTDYLFPAAGKRRGEEVDLFLYENPAHLGGGINIAFGDGRIEFRETGWANETLAPLAPPTVSGESFNVDAPRQAIQIVFSEDVYTSLAASDLVLKNLTTGQTINPSALSLSYDFVSHSATWTYNGILPDGNYTAALPAASVTDETGHALGGGFSLDFFVLAGDANRDRKVDLSDLLIMAQNFGGSGKVFSQGDFNYDGRVNAIDAVIWGLNFGHSLAPPPVVAVLRRKVPLA